MQGDLKKIVIMEAFNTFLSNLDTTNRDKM